MYIYTYINHLIYFIHLKNNKIFLLFYSGYSASDFNNP